MNRLYIFICLQLLGFVSFSQNFNYSLTKDSSAYSTLTSPNQIAGNNSWKDLRFELKLPFNFNFCGKHSDSLVIENNGYIEFVGTKSLALISFNSFTANKDTNNSYSSSIAYEIIGGSGNKILKIQFSNLSQNQLSNNDHLNYQIWLYENGSKIEIHLGTSSYSTNENTTSSLLGLINRNMDLEGQNALMIKGNSSSPSIQNYTIESGDLQPLDFMPNSGVFFRLAPNF